MCYIYICVCVCVCLCVCVCVYTHSKLNSVPACLVIFVRFVFLHSCMPSDATLIRLRQYLFRVSSLVVTFRFLAISHVLFQKISLKSGKGLLNLKSNIQRLKVKVTPSLFVSRRDAARTA